MFITLKLNKMEFLWYQKIIEKITNKTKEQEDFSEDNKTNNKMKKT